MHIAELVRLFLSMQDRLAIAGLALFACVVSCIEMVSLSAVMPFLLRAVNAQTSVLGKTYTYLANNYSLGTFGAVLLVLCIGRAVATVWFIHLLHQFSQGLFKRIGCTVFAQYLRSPYKDYVSWNSTSVLKMITNDAFHVGLVVSSLLQLLGELCVIGAMYAMLLWANWKLTLLVSGVGVFGGMLLMGPLIRAATYYGERKGYFWRQVNQIFQEGFGNFKMIRLLGAESVVNKKFEHASTGISQAYARYFAVQSYPRLVLETLFLVALVCSVLVVVAWYGAHAGSLLVSLLSLYGIAFYRVVPAINRLIAHYGQMQFSLAAIGQVHEQLVRQSDGQTVVQEQIVFAHELTISHVSFGYNQTRSVLHDVSLTIAKGQRVAFVGPSGSGKSTLIDILLGLHEPTSGNVSVDGVPLTVHNRSAWQRMIGYIPQQIYLFDGTVADNVVFGHATRKDLTVQARTTEPSIAKCAALAS